MVKEEAGYTVLQSLFSFPLAYLESTKLELSAIP